METEQEMLLLDFDNTIFDTRMPHVLYLNHTYQIQCTPDDFINNQQITKIIEKYKGYCPVTEEEAFIHLGEYFHASRAWHKEVRPIDQYVKAVLPELSKKYDLTLATTRNDASIDLVRHLLEMHFPKCVNLMHFVHKRLSYGKYAKTLKRSFVESVGPERFAGFIDDSTKEIKRMQGLIPCHLFDAWNNHQNEAGIESRLCNWKQVGELYL